MEFIKKIFSSEFRRGAFILLALITFGNILSYIFQFTMAWMLGPADYAILATITSIIALFGTPTNSLQTIIAKHTTELKVKNKIGNIKGMFKYLTLRVLTFSSVIFVLFSIISYFWLSNSLNISFSLLLLTGVFIFGAFLYPIGAGILQGTKKFKELGFSFIVNGILKLSIGISLVLIGWKVYGAVMGFILGSLFSFFIIFIFIRDILTSKESKEKISFNSNRNIFSFIAIMIFVFLFNLDVIFAKVFFSAEIAGKYAVLSLLGKIILFVTMSIGNVMFPINSEKFLKGEKGIIKKTLVFISIICSIVLVAFLFFPELIIKILFGEAYVLGGNILFYVGIGFVSLSFVNIFILNSISKNQFKGKQFVYMLSCLIIQIILFNFFHLTIEQFSIAFMVSAIITFFGGIIFLKPQESF